MFTGWVKALLALILLEGFHQVLAELIRQRGIDSEPGVGGGHEWYFWLDTANLVFYLLLFFLFFMIALVGGIGSSLGFSTPMIAALISRLTGIPVSFEMELFVVAACVAMFGTSVWLGLKRGIKPVSYTHLTLPTRS